MELIDWIIIALFFILSLSIGLWAMKKAGKNTTEFFLSGRNMPWWLLGISMVATTFSADTPNLVTDIIRQDGIAGNWVWWNFLLTGMLTVFIYARLWRKSKVLTDLEFYEIRYSGKEAAFLRMFRAVYLGVFFNIIVMAGVCLAAIKIGGVLLDLTPIQTLLIASTITVVYSMLGGLRGIIITDFFQFILAMIGSIWAAYVLVNLPEIGGLDNLLAHSSVVPKLNFIPDFNNYDLLLTLFIIPLAVQWWSVWYPGSEPGGGGYIAQRMLAAKDEKNAVGATLLFNVAHYALRPWPWVLIALASLIIFPDLDSLREVYPNIPDNKMGHDLAYPAMLSYLPAGLLGLVAASLVAAFMSTISTHLNWGASYVVHDFYKRFFKPNASEKELVLVGKISTFLMMFLAALLALYLESAFEAFKLILLIGAGTGLIFILRWFWWRINAYSEITGMLVSFLVGIYFKIFHKNILGFEEIADYKQLLLSVGITTFAWFLVTFLTRPTAKKKLQSFYKLTTPGGPGWKKVILEAENERKPIETKGAAWKVPMQILSMVIGCFTVYSALFGFGYLIFGNYLLASILLTGMSLGTIILFKIWEKN